MCWPRSSPPSLLCPLPPRSGIYRLVLMAPLPFGSACFVQWEELAGGHRQGRQWFQVISPLFPPGWIWQPLLFYWLFLSDSGHWALPLRLKPRSGIASLLCQPGRAALSLVSLILPHLCNSSSVSFPQLALLCSYWDPDWQPVLRWVTPSGSWQDNWKLSTPPPFCSLWLIYFKSFELGYWKCYIK